MTTVVTDRLVIRCDACPVRMDLGPAQVARVRNRTPSGWLSLGDNRHICPICALERDPDPQFVVRRDPSFDLRRSSAA